MKRPHEMLAISEAVQIALITTLGLVLVTMLPLLWGVHKRLDRDVGRANGEGNLVDMTARALEQVGMVRAEQAQVRIELHENTVITDGILATSVKTVEELEHVHDALRAHFDDHLAGKSWEVVVREKKDLEGEHGEG